MSTAEAQESVGLLTSLCPFFLRSLSVGNEDWVEMPASSSDAGIKPPESPGATRGKDESAEEVLTRSPRRIKREGGGLRQVREIIRRELELQE